MGDLYDKIKPIFPKPPATCKLVFGGFTRPPRRIGLHSGGFAAFLLCETYYFFLAKAQRRKEKIRPLPECCRRGKQAFLLCETNYLGHAKTQSRKGEEFLRNFAA
jgi:hypothetical protein